MGRQQRLKRERERARPIRRAPPSGPLLGGLRGVVLVSILAAIAAAGLVYAQQRPPDQVASASPTASASTATGAAGKTRGLASAPVTIEEWADFQCPACRLFHETLEPRILSELVASGEARLVFRDFVFIGDESRWAAEAADCASEQGKFWELHDALYDRQVGENVGTFTRANLKRAGHDVGLGPSFDTCVDSGRYADAVRAETQAGTAKGVLATPTLFVNGQKIEGVPNFDQLKAFVDQLAHAR